MYNSKLFLLMMDLLNLETPLENPGYAPDTRDATIHNLDVSMYCHLCITIQRYVYCTIQPSVNLLIFRTFSQIISRK